MWTSTMAYSDRVIIQSLKAFGGRDDVTVHDIAAYTEVPYGTVKRALSRLERTGRITRTGKGRRWGSRYDVKDETGAS